MNSPRGIPGPWVRAPGTLPALWRRARHAFVLLLVAAALPWSGVAQTTEQLVAQRRLEYEAAKLEHESALAAFDVVEGQFGDALREVDRARRTGDTNALERAFAVAYERSIPLGAQEDRVARLREGLDAARQRFIEVITFRLEQLLDLIDRASSATQRSQLDALWRDLKNELDSLEAERAGGLRFDPVVYPEIDFDPRDGPAELRDKAGLLERRAAAADTLIADADVQIRLASDQIRIQRQRRDLEANLNRFDDTRLPVVTGQPTGARPAAPDSASAGTVPTSPEGRLRFWQERREQLVSYRDQLLIRARVFRQAIRQVTE